MRKCNDEVYQLAKDQALVKKLKNKRFRPFCLCLPGVMFVTRGSKNSLFLSLIFFPTWIVVNDINFGSAKVFQWVPRRHKVLTHGQERLFRKVTSVSIHFFYWMVGHFPLRIATRSQRVKPHKVFCNWHCKRSYTLFLSSCYATLVRVVIGDSTCNACHYMGCTGRPLMKV